MVYILPKDRNFDTQSWANVPGAAKAKHSAVESLE